MSDFFASVPKKAKQSRAENGAIKETHAILDEIPNAPSASSVLAARMSACGKAFSTLDHVDEAAQKVLKFLQTFYHCTTASGIIKIIDGTVGACSMFHFNCDGTNAH